ncbi:cobalamin B12-binding domain-containing protein [Desulfosporosinus youngiae]|uniref:Methyltransferase cognate corrinoid protein n=1 Tax=Desulfosporosinus youngiae DSM 17734 TaxID=768710 RepID=H5Y5F3_9FIRM|nr:corrinoid protein [Desulfosporosinus youngiae]EHQ90403.1 methyltransferase cognate corrinoid protein [Desulfosporosinus youngiae DSM 17734]
MSNELFELAAQSIIDGDEAKAVEIAKRALAEGLDPLEVIEKGFTVGINKVGDLFDRGKFFLPELMVSSDAMKNAVTILNDAIPPAEQTKSIKALIATVEGDIHDIGKGLVVSLFRVHGMDVYDIGNDIPVDEIIDKALEYEVDVIGTSALLNTTMKNMKKLEDALRERGVRDKFKTIIGGAPVTQRYADKIGADAYAENANDGVKKILEMVKA